MNERQKLTYVELRTKFEPYLNCTQFNEFLRASIESFAHRGNRVDKEIEFAIKVLNIQEYTSRNIRIKLSTKRSRAANHLRQGNYERYLEVMHTIPKLEIILHRMEYNNAQVKSFK